MARLLVARDARGDRAPYWVAILVVAAQVTLVGPAAAQEGTTTSTTAPALLVEGTTSTAPPATIVAPPAGPGTAGEGTVAPADSDPLDAPGGLASPSNRLWLAAGILVLVALIVLVLTAVYWRSTRPARRAPPSPAPRTVDLDALLRPDDGET